MGSGGAATAKPRQQVLSAEELLDHLLGPDSPAGQPWHASIDLVALAAEMERCKGGGFGGAMDDFARHTNRDWGHAHGDSSRARFRTDLGACTSRSALVPCLLEHLERHGAERVGR
jgi:hypothetical protein